MGPEEYRLAAAALNAVAFSLGDLSRIAQANRNTTGSWFRRNRLLFEAALKDARAIAPDAKWVPGRGRPKKLWKVREGAKQELRAQLDGLYRSVMAAKGDSQLAIFDRIEEQLKDWQQARAVRGPESAAPLLLVARGLVRVAWEDFAEHYRLTEELDRGRLRTIAEYERVALLGELTNSDRLPAVATWLAAQMSRMAESGVPDYFAGAVLRARAEIRKDSDRVKLTAAALAASVWADEDVSPASEDALLRCLALPSTLSASQRLYEAARAIDARPSYGYCVEPDDAAAVVLGLVNLPAVRTTELDGWLAQLQLSNDWRPELAPAVARGLAEAPGIKLRLLVGFLEKSLREALQAAQHGTNTIGRLRKAALAYGSKLLDIPPDLGTRAASAGQPGAEEILANAAFFAYRPPNTSVHDAASNLAAVIQAEST